MEAALIFPLAFYAITIFLYLFLMVQTEFLIYQGLLAASDKLYVQGTSLAYIKNSGVFIDKIKEQVNENFSSLDIKEEWIDDFYNKGISYIYTKSFVEKEFKNYIEDNDIRLNLVKDGLEGIDFSESEIFVSQGKIKLVANYTIGFPGAILDVGNRDLSCQVKSVAFYGAAWDKSKEFVNEEKKDEEEETEDKVYVTKHGTVYHEKSDCTYIVVTADKVLLASIDKIRSANGAIYYPCETCSYPNYEGLFVYVTTYGTRYHIDKNCRQIEHYCEEIDRSEAEDRKLRPCSKCAKKEES